MILKLALRVIAGSAKKRRIKSPTGWTGRPTSDRVKEAVFNILGDLVPESIFLDLFAGTGSIGIEALSRGAKKAVFVEKESRAVKTINQNLEDAGLSDRAVVFGLDVPRAIDLLSETKDIFDIVFLDPPYDRGYEAPVVEKIAGSILLSDRGLVVVESSKRTEMPSSIEVLRLARQERYGDTLISFYRE